MSSNEVVDKYVTKEVDQIGQKVRYAQVQELYKQTNTGLIGVVIVSFTASVVFWEVLPHWKLTLWTTVIFCLSVLRGIIVFAFHRKTPSVIDIDRWAKLHVIGIIASGLTWAFPLLLLWPGPDSGFQLVWPIFVLPLCGAAIATNYTWKPSYVSYLLLTTLPISIRFFFEGGLLFNILACLCLFFIWVLLRAGKVMNSTSMRSLELGIRNEMLNKNLKVEIIKGEQLNEQLQEEIAERKLAENEIRKLSKVFSDGRNPTFIEDLNGKILELNDEAVNVYGFSREELVGKSIKLVLPNGSHEKMDELIKQCMEGELVRDIECLRRKMDGQEIPILLTLSLLTDENNKPFGIASIASNLSKQKNIERELIKSKATAESANATKDKFFKIISHDLRSPFNSIIGFTNLLNMHYDAFDDEERKDCIDKMNSSALYAFDLLENLLTWARAQTDEIKINKEKINLNGLVTTSVSTYLLNAESKNISIVNNVDSELILSVDENTALTFIRNIISNAIKFTPEGGKITIDAKLIKDKVELYIADTGVGMTSDIIDSLFKIDKGISTTGTNNEKGTGLGLILCKEFIERNGGSIVVSSEVNKGSEFIISLPLETD